MSTKKRVSFSGIPANDGNDVGVSAEHCKEQEGEHEDAEAQDEEEGEEAGYDSGGQGQYLNSFTDPALTKPSFPARVAYCSDGSPVSSATSPARKKIAALQDRRVNTILLEALQLVDCSKDELAVIEKSVKKLRDAIYGFSILVDKQVNIIGAETLEERGRIRADIQDLAENLKISYEVFTSTCTRMRHTLGTGKQHIQLHKKRIASKSPSSASSDSPVASSPSKRLVTGVSSPVRKLPLNGSAPSPSIADAGISFSPTCGRIPLMSIVECQPTELEKESGSTPLYMTPEFFGSLMRSVGLDEKEFLDSKDLMRLIQEMLTFSIAKSQSLTFMGKAFHRRLIPTYARELVQLILNELQLNTTATPVVPNNTFSDFMCQEPYNFDALLDRLYVSDANQYTGEPSPVASPMATPPANPFSDHFTRNGGVIHDGQIVQTLLVNKPDAEMLETAEQTLAMAKLLHDLANAESEARRGNRISIRAQPSRSNEFSKAYLATSKELLSRESGL